MMMEFKVTGLGIDTRTDHPLVILHSRGELDMILPIWIGRLEAQSIAIAMQGEKTERPLTHDLMMGLIQSLNCTIDRIEIHSVHGGTFYAHLILRSESDPEAIIIDARPSDCIALALRAECSIYVSENVREQSCIPAMVRSADDDGEDSEKEEFLKFLDTVKASDFKLPNDGKENRNS